MDANENIKKTLLKAVFEAALGQIGESVRRSDLAHLSGIDPATFRAAIDQLLADGYLALGATDDRICLTVTAAAMVRSRIPVA